MTLAKRCASVSIDKTQHKMETKTKKPLTKWTKIGLVLVLATVLGSLLF